MLLLVKEYCPGRKVRYYLSNREINQMQIPDEIRKCVVFIYCPTDSGKKPYGTGFFVCENIPNIAGKIFTYIVTAKHVLKNVQDDSKNGTILLRINFKDGTSDFIPVNIDKWFHHPIDDVSVLPLKLSREWDVLCEPVEFIVDDKVLKETEIDIGDETFAIGLFSKHEGKSRNIPIVRVGNISAMPEEKIKINNDIVDAYLIETRSFGGLSGSPVFVNLGLHRSLNGIVKINSSTGYVFYLLGLIRAHWDWKNSGYDYFSREINVEEINLGMSIVTPAVKILEVINLPKLIKRKKEYIDRIIKS